MSSYLNSLKVGDVIDIIGPLGLQVVKEVERDDVISNEQDTKNDNNKDKNINKCKYVLLNKMGKYIDVKSI